MEALLVSTGVVALAEIGDKTQLLTLVLAARYKRPWPIVAGIFVATLVNHFIAGAVGAWLGNTLDQDALRWGSPRWSSEHQESSQEAGSTEAGSSQQA